MSCNGFCSPRYALMFTTRGGGMGYVRPTHGTLALGSYSQPSYFADPNAITALEFEQHRQPRYVRTQDLQSYQGIRAPSDYGIIMQGIRHTDPVMHGNLEYFESLNRRGDDYSLRHQALAAEQSLKGLVEGNLRVVRAEQLIREMPYAERPAQVTVDHGMSGVEEQRSMLERLLAEEVNLN